MCKLFLGAIALLFLQVQSASADMDFDFTVTCPTCIVTQNTSVLVTTPQTTPGEFLVTNILGGVGPFPASIIAPGGVAGISGKNDNLLSFPANPAFFSVGGLGISINGGPTDVACDGSNSACVVLFPDPIRWNQSPHNKYCGHCRPRPHHRRWPARSDICRWWPACLVAQ